MMCVCVCFYFLFWNNFKLTEKMARTVQAILIFYSPRNIKFHGLSQWKRVKLKELVPQSYLTLGEPTVCSPPGSSVQGILQARILEWVANPFSRRSSRLRDQTQVSLIVGSFFTIWATRETPSVSVMSFKAKGSNPGSHAVVCVSVLLCLFSFLWPRMVPQLFCSIFFNWVCLVLCFHD